MDTIIHALEIEAAAPDVYRAISTESGLQGWWTTKVTAAETAGGIVDFTFNEEFNPDMEIVALDEPTRVVWKCVGGHDPWQGSEFHFDIEPLADNRCRLMFRQTYGKPIDDVAYGIYNFNWGYYMQSLKDLVETGAGKPHVPAS